MQLDLKKEHIDELIGIFGENFFAHAPIEERLKGLSPSERMGGLSKEQIKAYLKKMDDQ